MTVEAAVTLATVIFVRVFGLRSKQNMSFNSLKYYPLLFVCLQQPASLPSAVLSLQISCEDLGVLEGIKQCYIEHFDSNRSSLSVLRSKLPAGVKYVKFQHFEASAIDQSIFNCFANSVKVVVITDSQSLLKIVVPGNLSVEQLNVEKTQLIWIRFHTNEHITVVWIIYSNLQQMPPSLKNLKNLNNEKQQHSNIQQLSLDLLKWCRKLVTLDLPYNNIHTITSTLTGEQRRDLNMLNLSNNELRMLNLEVLAPVGWFKFVDLSYNKIELLVGQFSSDRLISITLSHNRLKTLDFCQWKSMPRLSSVISGWNELLHVPNCINQLSNLSYVCLSNNELSSVNMDAFGNMENLLDLDLSANQISLIIFREENYPKRLRMLILRENKIKCNNPSDLPICSLDIEFQPRKAQSEWHRTSGNFLKQLKVVS